MNNFLVIRKSYDLEESVESINIECIISLLEEVKDLEYCEDDNTFQYVGSQKNFKFRIYSNFGGVVFNFEDSMRLIEIALNIANELKASVVMLSYDR